MTTDDTDDHRVDEGGGDDVPADRAPTDIDSETDGRRVAVEEVDQRIVDLLSWILDTETRAKIYVHLLANPGSTSEEVAKGTGLYPSTVREALAELHEETRVSREKRANEGAGNNPYEYTAIQPSDLVSGVVDQVQQELNTIFRLDRVLDRQSEEPPTLEDDLEPVKITVDDATPQSDGESDNEPMAIEDDMEIDTVDTDAEDEDETADSDESAEE